MRSGFTLIELLLVIGIFLVVGAAVPPLYGNLSVSAQLTEATSGLAGALRFARERSLAGFRDSRHGVCLETAATGDRYIIYRGTNCAARVASEDQITELPPVLRLTTTLTSPDINFSGRGVPSVAGVITLTHVAYGSRTIAVSPLGLVEEN